MSTFTIPLMILKALRCLSSDSAPKAVVTSPTPSPAGFFSLQARLALEPPPDAGLW